MNGALHLPIFRRRLGLAAIGLSAWAGLVGMRLIQLQLFEVERYRQLARRQHERTIDLNPVRGTIYDRGLRELAVSVDLPSLYVVPSEVQEPGATADRLAPLLDLEPDRLRRLLESERPFVWLRRKVPPGVRDRVEALGLAGIGSLMESARLYPNLELAAHVLGFAGIDNVGLAGLEYTYDSDVRGTPGSALAWMDARRKRFAIDPRRPPRPGHGLVLTLDLPLQFFCEQALERALRTTGAPSGTVVVVEPDSGAILALANRPTYDPNQFNRYAAATRINRAVESYYEPGSTFKVITAASALEAQLVSPDQTFFCENGRIRLASGQVVRDHKPFGLLTLRQVLAHSSNVGIIKVGLLAGPEVIHRQVLRCGFGQRTGVRLPGENAGVVPDPARWSGRTIGAISIGQEIGVTALQMVLAVAAVANGGLRPAPRVVERLLDSSGMGIRGEQPAEPVRILSPENAAILTDMMEAVVREGTGKAAALPGYRLAGKTGTAEKIGDSGAYEQGRYVASFVGFGPLPNPRFAAIVVIDEPEGFRYHGGEVAAPVFRELAAAFLRLHHLPPAPPPAPEAART